MGKSNRTKSAGCADGFTMSQNGSLARKENPKPDNDLLSLTIRAYGVSIAAAHAAADLVLGANSALSRIVSYERELDELDREFDERVADELAHSSVEKVREKLACLKCMRSEEHTSELQSPC